MSVIFAGLAFFLVFLEKQLHMRTELDTEFGLDDGKRGEKEAELGEKDSALGEKTGFGKGGRAAGG